MKPFVLVPIHDREEFVGPCLDALENSGLDYDLCVVANGCTFDPTPYLRRARYAENVPEPLGPPAARNVGMKHRKPTQDFLSLDSDVVLQTPNWLARMRATLYSKGSYGAVSPAIDNGDGPLFHGITPNQGIQVRKTLPVGARLFKGHVVDALGYFRVYGIYGCEDLDYDARIDALGYDLIYDTDIVCTHPGIPSDDKWKRAQLELGIPKLTEWKRLYEAGQMLYKGEPEMDFVPDMNPRWLAAAPSLEQYGTHMAGLRWAVENTEGPILELGAGYHSTPYLNTVSRGMRHVITVENDKRWRALVAERCESSAHWLVEQAPPGRWSVVLLDSDEKARAQTLKDLAPWTDIFVIHDTEPEGFAFYGWSEADFNAFAYRYDYGDKPRTTLVSNTVDVRKMNRMAA